MDKKGQPSRAVNLMLGIGSALLIDLLLILSGALLVVKEILPAEQIRLFLSLGMAVASFTGALVLLKRERGLTGIWGLAPGAALMLISWLLGLLLYDKSSFANGGLPLLCTAMAGGLAGGLTARSGKKRRKSGRRRRQGEG